MPNSNKNFAHCVKSREVKESLRGKTSGILSAWTIVSEARRMV